MTGYIAEMRKLVGHRTLMQCAGSVICVDGRGRLLLGRRTDNHLWGYAGGSVEIDERVEDCAVRELREETGLIADEIEFFCVNSGPETHYIYPNGDEVSNVEIIYLCRRYHGELSPQASEIEELRWFAPEEICIDMISPPIRPVFRQYLRQSGHYGEPVPELKPVGSDSADLRLLEEINREAIPENERISLADMLATGAEITGIYEEGMPVGFMAVRRFRSIVYLAFLAVRADLRSRGTGGKALRELIRRHPDCRVVVEFEVPDEPGNPGNMKTRRKNFYLRSGFRETGWYAFYDETEFEIACAGQAYDPEAFGCFVAWLKTFITGHIPEPYRK